MTNSIFLETQNKAQSRCLKSLEIFERAMVSIRSGRASVDILDGVKANNFGVLAPLRQMANITTPDTRTLMITPFTPQKEVLADIEKAIVNSDLGLQPSNDGKVIRISLPELTRERREQLVKQLEGKMEEFRIALRNIRRDILHEIRKLENISEDDIHELEKKVQKTIDQEIVKASNLCDKKRASIMAL